MKWILAVIVFCLSAFAANGQSLINDRPKVALSIVAVSDSVKVGRPIMLRITVTNNQEKAQKMLIDKPVLWAFTGNVADLKTGQSVLSYSNRAMSTSQVYQEKDLKDFYHVLKPGQSITTEQDLRGIVIFNTLDYKLPKGAYKMHLDYYGNTSNAIIFYVD